MNEFLYIVHVLQIPFFRGWSLWGLFQLALVLTALSMVLNYFFDAAKKG